MNVSPDGTQPLNPTQYVRAARIANNRNPHNSPPYRQYGTGEYSAMRETAKTCQIPTFMQYPSV
ncbi:MAG: hypothetical protein BroJett007_02460 [Chloroflexota bacterium]|nr:MAG: hypothetical protein BroJett007_02460 [Chloroflexota bacterium]